MRVFAFAPVPVCASSHGFAYAGSLHSFLYHSFLYHSFLYYSFEEIATEGMA